MLKVQLDAVNKTAQFQLKDSLAAFTLDLMGYVTGDDVTSLSFSDIKDKMNVRTELIRKNQPNITLLDLPLNELSDVLDIAYDGGANSTIPVALDKNLVLNSDTFILVTLEWKDISITKLNVFYNRVIGDTDKPISIKSVPVDEQTEVNTEFYNVAVFGEGIKSLETIITDMGDDGVAVSAKQELTYDYLRLLRDNKEGAILPVRNDQRVKFFGNGKVFLLQA